MLRAIVTNPNDYNNDEYIKDQKLLSIENEKWNNRIIERRKGQQLFQFLKSEEQKPIISKLDELIQKPIINKSDEVMQTEEIQQQKPEFNVNKKVK